MMKFLLGKIDLILWLITTVHFLFSFDLAAKDKISLSKYTGHKMVIKFSSKTDFDLKALRSPDSQTSMTQLNTIFKVQVIEPLFPKAESPVARRLGLDRLFRFSFASDIDLGNALLAYQNDPNVEYAEAIGLHPLLETIPNDPDYFRQWALPYIDMPKAWDIATGDTSVILAIIDSGVDWTHPDLGGAAPYLAGNIWINWPEWHGKEGVDDDGNGYVDDVRGWDWVDGASAYAGEDNNMPDNDPMDFYGHGTHVAGIAAAIGNNAVGGSGMSWRCKIMPLRAGYAVSRFTGEVDMSFCAQAIYYAVRMGATAINCSWASSNTGGIKEALDFARDHGVLILASAGNEGVSEAYYLSARPEVITVASVNFRDQKSSSSNFGYWIDLAAPGEAIFSTISGLLSPSGSAGYANLSGTSMAAPFAAGLAGLLKSNHPTSKFNEIRSAILQGFVAIDSLNATYQNGLLGAGRISAFKALTQIRPDNYTIIFAEDFAHGLPATWQSDPLWHDDDPAQRNANSDDRVVPGTIHVGYDIWEPPFMIVDSDYTGATTIDAILTTPAIDCQYFHSIRLMLDNWFQPYNGGTAEIGAIDISVDNVTWQNIAKFHSFPGYTANNVDAGKDCIIRLPASADHQKNLKLRFHYYNASFDWFWGIDNIRLLGRSDDIGTISGTITDATTGKPIENVTVQADTITCQSDRSGAYSLTLPVGIYSLELRAHPYESQMVANVSVTTGTRTIIDVALRSAHIALYPDRLETTLGPTDSITHDLVITNIGRIDLRINRIIAVLDSSQRTGSPAQPGAQANDLPWLSVSPDSGRISPADSLMIEVKMSSNSLLPGNYKFYLNISSNDPDDSLSQWPVHLLVADYPFGHQDLALRPGWNLISWRMDTNNDSIPALLGHLLSDIDIILGFEDVACTYDPQLPQFSNLTTVDHLHGYWLKMKADRQLRVFGTPPAQRQPQPLRIGWNLVSYLPSEPDSTPNALQSILPNLVIAMGFDQVGFSFDPQLPLASTLTVMKPGFGYWLKTNAADTLIFPEKQVSVSNHQIFTSERDPALPAPTASWMNVYADSLIVNGRRVASGSTILALTQSGIVCGKGFVGKAGQLPFMPVYGDDPQTEEKEGPMPGEKICFFLADSLLLTEAQWTHFGAVIHLPAPVTLAHTPGVATPTQFTLSQNYPNPLSLTRENAGTLIRYQIAQSGRVRIIVTNVLGQVSRILVDEIKAAGDYQILWNGTDARGQVVANGIYWYRLETENYSQTRKMLVLR